MLEEGLGAGQGVYSPKHDEEGKRGDGSTRISGSGDVWIVI